MKHKVQNLDAISGVLVVLILVTCYATSHTMNLFASSLALCRRDIQHNTYNNFKAADTSLPDFDKFDLTVATLESVSR